MALLLAAEVEVDSRPSSGQLLLDACARGDYKYVSQYLSREGPTACDIESSDLNQTPLHLAAENGHIRIVKLLLSKADPMKKDVLKKTPFMCACGQGRVKVVQLLLEEVPEIRQTINEFIDKYKQTSLHMAAASGHVKVVKLLLENGADGKLKDKFQRTPMRSACINGHAQVVKILVGKGMDKSPVKYEIVNKKGGRETVNILMEAINRELHDVAMVIISSRQVRESLQYKTEIKGKETTPMRLLFQKMPEVAESALMYFTTQPRPEDRGDDSKKYNISFRYEFLDDFVDVPNNENGNESVDESTPLITTVNSGSDMSEQPQSWRPVRRDQNNHCLQVLVNSKSKVLVRHPVVTTLLYHKWDDFARTFFILALLIHAVFAVLLTTFALITLQPKSQVCLKVFNSTDYEGHCELGNLGQPYAIGIVGVAVILIAGSRLLFEAFRLVVLRLQYFTDIINYMEIIEFTGAILFVFVFSSKCFCPSSWQWQVGAGCVFLSWIDMLLFIRLFPVFGIFVVMFLRIVKNFAKVATFLAIFLVLSFTFPFYMMFHDPRISPDIRTPFNNPVKTFVKTLTMMTSGVSFDTLFHLDYKSDGEGVQYAGISYPLIIIFIVVMTILLNNLLTGLAVGDVKEVRAEAKIRTLTLWVKFILLVEQLLWGVPFLRKRYVKRVSETFEIEDIHQYPNTWTKWFWYRALEFSHFDTYETKIINPDPVKSNEKLMNQLDELMTKMEKVEDKLNDLALRHADDDD